MYMAISNKIIQVNPNALVEYIWDDNFFYTEDYSIIRDVKNNVSSFTFSENIQDQDNYNKIPNQLYLIDPITNRYGVADPDEKTFLHEQQYTNTPPVLFNKVKIWFPINFVFPNSVGFYLRVFGLNFENALEYNFSNFFLDITEPGNLSLIENETIPFRYNEKLWGKSIEIYVPSLNSESQKRTNNAPTLGSINYNLTNGQLGLSQTSPIFLDFRFLQNKKDVLGEMLYTLTPERTISFPQAPEYNNLSVQIERATDGDYFEINGIYNGTVAGFNDFMQVLEQSGKRSYILYSITKIEENIPQDPVDIYVYKDFWKGIDDYRPLFKFSNTTAGIRVDMKLINSVNNSVITRSTEISIVGNEVAKYSKNLTSINVSNAIKPKLYNSAPTQIQMSDKQIFLSPRRKRGLDDQIKLVPYPVLTNVENVVAKDINVEVDDQIYAGLGELTLNFTPFDNIIKLNIFEDVSNNLIPFEINSSNTIVQMVFKSQSNEIRLPLYNESNEVNLKNGILVFKVPASEMANLRKINNLNNSFYVTVTTNGIETSIYDGKYRILQDVDRNKILQRLKSMQNTNLIRTDLQLPKLNTSNKPKRTNINQIVSANLDLSKLRKIK